MAEADHLLLDGQPHSEGAAHTHLALHGDLACKGGEEDMQGDIRPKSADIGF